MIKIYSFICWILSFLFTKQVLEFISRIKLKIQTYSQERYYRSNLKFCGENIVIHEPNTLKGLNYISVGSNFKGGKYLVMEAWDFHNNITYTPDITIGNNVSIGMFCHIACINKVIIEDDVLIAGKVFITDHSHGNTTKNDLEIPPNIRRLYSKGQVRIKKNAWIGENVSILPGVIVGENAVIGANSVVTKDIPDNAIAIGSPARIVKIA